MMRKCFCVPRNRSLLITLIKFPVNKGVDYQNFNGFAKQSGLCIAAVVRDK